MSEGRPAYGSDWSASLARGSERERRAWLDFALETADAADEIAMRWFRQLERVDMKADRTFVTEADTGVERLVRERIGATFPGHGIVGEEFGTEAADAPARWYIDPIDATSNFVRGVPVFALLLALEVDGEPQVAVMSAPAMGERWYAARGLGAWAVGGASGAAPRQLQVSGVADLQDAHLLHGELRDLDGTPLTPGFRALVDEVWRTRNYGDFWMYGLLAEGAAEIVVEPDLNPWDLAAPVLVVEEAGGRFTDLTGRRTIWGRSALATNGVLHDVVLERLTKGGRA
ncbi:MAG TPA: inositol monophosphatase family protein [Candidatus Limnocylindrales bacterium]|nr:inositol monophosphatase family protein [Candidatus Limnocylindrales bacterium]